MNKKVIEAGIDFLEKEFELESKLYVENLLEALEAMLSACEEEDTYIQDRLTELEHRVNELDGVDKKQPMSAEEWYRDFISRNPYDSWYVMMEQYAQYREGFNNA